MNTKREQEVIGTIFAYLENGQSLNDVIETTNITFNECMQALGIIKSKFI